MWWGPKNFFTWAMSICTLHNDTVIYILDYLVKKSVIQFQLCLNFRSLSWLSKAHFDVNLNFGRNPLSLLSSNQKLRATYYTTKKIWNPPSKIFFFKCRKHLTSKKCPMYVQQILIYVHSTLENPKPPNPNLVLTFRMHAIKNGNKSNWDNTNVYRSSIFKKDS